MANTLDFNTVKKPALKVRFKDEKKTMIEVMMPTVAMIKALQANYSALASAVETGDQDSVRSSYDLMALLMSSNRSGKKITGEDLMEKYEVGLDDLVLFASAYMEFVEGQTKGKN